MTTMDSDSESQDSDEGRRFRFEATRKDSHISLNSRKRRTSPVRTEPRRRSRSTDRINNRDRRNDERARHDYRKNSRGNLDVRRSSRDGDSRISKEIDSSRNSFRHKDSKDSRNSSNSSFNHKESKTTRESPFRKSKRDSKTRERERKRSADRSTDRNFDDKQLEKYTNKFTARNKRNNNSRERSRERSHQANKQKNPSDFGRSREQLSKNDSIRKSTRKDDEVKNIKNNEKNVKENDVNSESDANSRASSPSSTTECKDLNLSDFDIVSDIEEHSPDNSSYRSRNKESIKDDDTGIKKRVSKQQYERLLKRQAVKNRRCSEELNKVKDNNGDNSSGKSNNNRSKVSDFELTEAEASTTIAKFSSNDRSNLSEKDLIKNRDNNKEIGQSDSDNSQSNCSTYGPILPPKIVQTSELKEESCDKDVSQLKEKITTRVIGPTLPDHLRKIVTEEADAEDTFGPALPPHLEQHKISRQDDVEESLGLPDNLDLKEEFAKSNRAESDADDDDDDFMGPLPSDHPALENDVVQRQLELRARRLKAELAACDNEDEKKREEWMIELPPPSTVNLGLGPRKFRARPAPDMSDRSSWTDTPADKARKRMERLENRNVVAEPTASQEREADISETEKSRKRQKSLLELHQKKLTKKKKKEEKELKKLGKTAERRPFDRDIDLQANRFDEARKKSMMMKSRQLDDRFSRGKI